jgi:hypothetical protein
MRLLTPANRVNSMFCTKVPFVLCVTMMEGEEEMSRYVS